MVETSKEKALIEEIERLSQYIPAETLESSKNELNGDDKENAT